MKFTSLKIIFRIVLFRLPLIYKTLTIIKIIFMEASLQITEHTLVIYKNGNMTVKSLTKFRNK